MKSDRFTDAQIMGVIRQAEGGVSVPDLCREHVTLPDPAPNVPSVLS